MIYHLGKYVPKNYPHYFPFVATVIHWEFNVWQRYVISDHRGRQRYEEKIEPSKEMY